MAEKDENVMAKIIERAVQDEKFREKLVGDPAAVAAEYGVAEPELRAVLENNEQFSGELEARVSKRKMMGRFGGLSGPMGIDGVEE
jgi:hypothetical protein